MATDSNLIDFADNPFGALLEIERRSRLVAGATGRGGETRGDWVGLGFRVGEHRFVVARDEVREVLVCPPLTRVPGARSWLRGLANVRGTLLPVTDLRYLLEGRMTGLYERMARIVVLRHPEVPAGFAVDEVYGFRQFAVGQRDEQAPEVPSGYRPFVNGAFSQNQEKWPVFSFYHLVEDEIFNDATDRELMA